MMQKHDLLENIDKMKITELGTTHKAKKSRSKKQLIEEWLKEEERFNLIGWDFSCVAESWVTENIPWDYGKIIKSILKNTDTLLDMGTGGGEFLLSLEHPYEKTYVTEAYPPNVELCKSKLAPLGITVSQTFEDDQLPFDDGSFNIIINRHESFDLLINAKTEPTKIYFCKWVVRYRDRKIVTATKNSPAKPIKAMRGFSLCYYSVGVSSHAKPKACAVNFPTLPSTISRFFDWKCLTATAVFAPYIPFTLSCPTCKFSLINAA